SLSNENRYKTENQPELFHTIHWVHNVLRSDLIAENRVAGILFHILTLRVMIVRSLIGSYITIT
ncbi:MAG TPA: hypothetical protein VFI33_02140, partial [Puia sp.]|nr:hypothetical protein [Puia sp.]